MTVATDLVTATKANTSRSIDARTQQVVAGITARLAAIAASPGVDQAATVALINAVVTDFNDQKDELAGAVRSPQAGVRPRYF